MPQPDPVVVQVLRDHREALRLRERGQMADMALRYAQIERTLASEMELLARDMAERKAAGQAVTEGALYRMGRYQALQAQIKREIDRYNREYADPYISREQEYYGDRGIQSAYSVLGVQAGGAGINITWNRLPTSAIENMIGLAGNGSPLYRLLANAYPVALDGVIKQLIDSTALGINPRETARRMANGLGLGLDRILTIARTEQLRVYRMASTEQYRESGIVTGYRRLVTKDARTCLACLASDGEHFDVASELEDHPNGRCAAVPDLRVGPRVQWEPAPQWFDSLDEGQQRQMMGATRYEAWKDHRIGFADLRRTAHNETWGDSPRMATLAELGLA